MAVVVYFITFVVLAAGVVHQHYVVVDQLFVTVFLQERKRGVSSGFYGLAFGVVLRPCEFCGRYTQVQDKHAVDGTQHFCFCFLHGGRLGVFRCHVTELQTLFAKFQSDQTRHADGVFAAVRFGHHVFGDETVFAYDVRHSGECTAVAQRIAEQPFHHFIVHRLVAGIDDALQEQISLFQLIEKERIGLREFERTQIVFVDGFGTHYVQTGEEPATSGRFLVGDTLGVHFDRKMRIHPLHVVLIQGKLTDVVVADGVPDSLVGRSALITLFDLLHHVSADAAFRVLCLCRIIKGTANKN